jgi:hypothetical protein
MNLYPSQSFAFMNTDTTSVVTKEEHVVSNKAIETDFIAPCTREEADTHMFLHAKHAAIGGRPSYMMTTNSLSTPISLCVKLSHGELKQWNTSFAFSSTFQACHAVFSPFQTNADTVSQPVNHSYVSACKACSNRWSQVD